MPIQVQVALITAAVGGVFAVIAWIARWLEDRGRKAKERAKADQDWQDRKRAALVLFFVDLRTRRENMAKKFSSERRLQLHADIDTYDDGYRPFGVEDERLDEIEGMRAFLPGLSEEEIARFQIYADYVRLFTAYNAEMQSDAFACLPAERKKRAATYLYSVAHEIVDLSDKLTELMCARHAELSEIRPTVDRVVSEAESASEEGKRGPVPGAQE